MGTRPLAEPGGPGHYGPSRWPIGRCGSIQRGTTACGRRSSDRHLCKQLSKINLRIIGDTAIRLHALT